MKQVNVLSGGWHLWQAEAGIEVAMATLPDHALPCEMPAQVAEVLLEHGKIEDPRSLDNARQALWVAEADWLYHTRFAKPEIPPSGRVFLHAKGLDTVADVFLNGQLIAEHRNMYLPLRVEITQLLVEANDLRLHFHPPHRWIAQQPQDPRWQGRVQPNRILRKPHEDFNSFNGAYPYFTPIGIYDEVTVEVVERAEFTDVALTYTLERTNVDLSQGYTALPRAFAAAKLLVAPEIAGGADAVRVTVFAPDSTEAATGQGKAGEPLALTIEQPQLWWPLGYGQQPLYTVVTELLVGSEIVDRVTKRLGFREISMGGDFDLRCNGIAVKLWGANFALVEQFTHVWPKDRATRLVELATNSHTVTLRLWGPGAPYADELFDKCDEAGILLWSEFYHTWGMYPDAPEYLAQCREEAEKHVKRLRHHASVFMWCGGNEVHMGVDVMRPGEGVISTDLYHHIYREVCAKLDPGRYYHADSPTGGDFPNDPLGGDTHGYTHFWFVRGCQFPIMLSENARWSPPQIETLQKFIGTAELWPKGFVSRIQHRRAPASGPGAPATGVAGNNAAVESRDFYENGLIPPAWQRLGKDGNITNRRAGPIGQFYDTGDTPEGLIYRIGSAHASFLREEIERLRRGKPAHEAHLPRKVRGHYWWRFNGTWPLIESELVDYLLAPKMAYYAYARAMQPILLSFEYGNHAHLWAVNDTAAPIHATLHLQLLPMSGGKPRFQHRSHVTLLPGQSNIIHTLDDYGMVLRNLVQWATLTDESGNLIATTTDFPEYEANLTFPDAQLTLERLDHDHFRVTTDVYARSIHLSGNWHTTPPLGDRFPALAKTGPLPYFSDNYFDLAPGEHRDIRILGGNPTGHLTAKPWWSTNAAKLSL